MKIRYKIKIISLVVLLISSIFTTSSIYGLTNNQDPQPILYYNFNDENATDMTGTYSGQLINNPEFITSKAGLGKALKISNGNYIKIPDNFKLGKKDFSISFLVKSLETKNDTVLLANKDGSSGTDDGFSIMNYNGTFGNAGYNGKRFDTSSYSRDETVLDGNWRHVVISAKRDQTLALYVDGRLSSENTEFSNLDGISLDTDQNFVLGASSTGEYSQDALYDEFKIFEQALSSKEVQNIYFEFAGDIQLELTQIINGLASDNINVPLKANQEMKTKEITSFIKKQIKNNTGIELEVKFINENKYLIKLSKANKSVSKEMYFDFNEKDVLTIATYNMYGWGYPNLETINEKLESIDADVVGLQEANWQPDGNGQVDCLSRIGSFPYSAFKAGYGNNVVWGGSAIVSKYPLLDIDGKNYQINDSTNRSYVKSTIQIGDKEVAVYNTHIVWLEDSELYAKYKEAQINELIEAVNNDKTPYKIITGDFNTDQSKEELDQLLLNFNSVNGWNNTWYDSAEMDSSMKTGSIDHIFTTTNISFENIGILEGNPSDHDILYADLILNDNHNVLPTQLLDNTLLEAYTYLNNKDNYEIDGINNLEKIVKYIENQTITKDNLYPNVLSIRQCISDLEEKVEPIKAPILHYNFDNNNAEDKNNNYNGKLLNAPKFESGFIGNSLITGKGYVEIPENFKLGSKDFTISYWFKSNEDKQDTVFFANKTGDSGNDKGLFICNYDGLYVNVGDGNTRYDSSSYNRDKIAMDGSWHYITVVAKRDQELSLYVDGKLSSSNKDFAKIKELNLDTDTPYVIGSGNTGKYSQKSNIDEFKIYDFSFEPNQVLKTFKSYTSNSIEKEELFNALAEIEKLINSNNFNNLNITMQKLIKTNYNDAQDIYENQDSTINDYLNQLNKLNDTIKYILKDLIDKCLEINLDDFTESSIIEFNRTLAIANEIYSNENSKINQIILVYNNLFEAKNNLIKTQLNKLALSIALDMAESVTQEQLDKVVPVVANEFKAALQNAQNVFDNAKASREEVDNAFDRLAKVMQMLEFYKGDKAALQKMMDQIASLSANDYTDSTWKALQAVLPGVNEVLGNVNAMQEEVDE
ncbi:LamG-like jellyroll fold domain-containing protein, partial [Thomasclavelia sp.]